MVGSNAARVAMGFEAHVTVIDKSLRRLQALDMQFGPALNTVFSTVDAIEEHVLDADLVVGAVLIPGGSAPRLVTEDMVRNMKRGSVLVDVSIDQGGCFDTSQPTSHAEPTYKLHDVVHYCVANMPGAVARTSTFALNNATLPFVVALANKGYAKAMRRRSASRQRPQCLPRPYHQRRRRRRPRRTRSAGREGARQSLIAIDLTGVGRFYKSQPFDFSWKKPFSALKESRKASADFTLLGLGVRR